MRYNDIKNIGKMKLVGDRILVVKDKPEEKTASGILLPGEVNNDPIAKVVSVGPEVDLELIASGDYIMHVKFAGQAFEIDGAEYIVLQKNEVIGVLS